MSAPRSSLRLSQRPDVRLRAKLLARIQTVQLLRLNESQVASLLKEIEEDPLFQKIVRPVRPEWKIVRYQPHPRTRLSSSFYEINEGVLPASSSAETAGLLDESRGVLDLIHKMGRANFEKYFLYADYECAPEEAAAACGVSPEEAGRVRAFLLSYSVLGEFLRPSSPFHGATAATCLARVGLEGDDVVFEYMSPHLARGRFDIHYDRLKALADREDVPPEERRRLRALVRRLELFNWRQNTLFRLLDLLTHTQRFYLKTRESVRRRPLTQRQMAAKLSVAPSTVNRAIHGRSVILPWEEEVMIEDLFCSRKELCLDALDVLTASDPDFQAKTDLALQTRLETDLGFPVPRRTVNNYRRALEATQGGVKRARPGPAPSEA
jgi:hypothetical protein